MATWAKIKFYYDTMLGAAGSTLTASSTATGDYSVSYLYNMLETNLWKAANTTTPMYITYDAGGGNTKSADYLAILGHNLKTIGASVTLQYSTDGVNYSDAYTAEAVPADTVYVKEFTSPGAKRYWRLKITGTLSAAPYMAICIWGTKTELDYATSSFDPYAEEVKAAVGMSQAGYVTGVHVHYSERDLPLRFDDADSTLYAKVKAWWDAVGIKNFFVAWDTANYPTEVYLMRSEFKFYNPLNLGGARRSITINLRGRKA